MPPAETKKGSAFTLKAFLNKLGLGDMLKAEENQKLYYENYDLKHKYIELDDKNNELKREIERLNSMITPELLSVNAAASP